MTVSDPAALSLVSQPGTGRTCCPGSSCRSNTHARTVAEARHPGETMAMIPMIPSVLYQDHWDGS